MIKMSKNDIFKTFFNFEKNRFYFIRREGLISTLKDLECAALV